MSETAMYVGPLLGWVAKLRCQNCKAWLCQFTHSINVTAKCECGWLTARKFRLDEHRSQP